MLLSAVYTDSSGWIYPAKASATLQFDGPVFSSYHNVGDPYYNTRQHWDGCAMWASPQDALGGLCDPEADGVYINRECEAIGVEWGTPQIRFVERKLLVTYFFGAVGVDPALGYIPVEVCAGGHKGGFSNQDMWWGECDLANPFSTPFDEYKVWTDDDLHPDPNPHNWHGLGAAWVPNSANYNDNGVDEAAYTYRRIFDWNGNPVNVYPPEGKLLQQVTISHSGEAMGCGYSWTEPDDNSGVLHLGPCRVMGVASSDVVPWALDVDKVDGNRVSISCKVPFVGDVWLTEHQVFDCQPGARPKLVTLDIVNSYWDYGLLPGNGEGFAPFYPYPYKTAGFGYGVEPFDWTLDGVDHTKQIIGPSGSLTGVSQLVDASPSATPAFAYIPRGAEQLAAAHWLDCATWDVQDIIYIGYPPDMTRSFISGGRMPDLTKKGIYRSKDGGLTWTQVLLPLPFVSGTRCAAAMEALEIIAFHTASRHPNNKEVLLVVNTNATEDPALYSSLLASVQAVLNAHTNLNFVDRILHPLSYPYLTLDNGMIATHLMMEGSTDDADIVFPSIVYYGGALHNLGQTGTAAFDYAIAHGEYISFTSEMEALTFSQSYKLVWKAMGLGEPYVDPPANAHSEVRCAVTVDGGVTWRDISTGLPTKCGLSSIELDWVGT